MVFEDELRTRLRAHEDRTDLHLDALALGDRLALVHRRARRRVARRRALTCSAALVLLFAVAVLAPMVWQALRVPDRVIVSEPQVGVGDLVGNWTGTVGSTTPSGGGKEVIGSWTLTITADGQAVPKPPRTFTGSTEPFAFRVRDGHFEANPFVNDLCAHQPAGRYAFLRSGNSLTFLAVNEPCSVRAAVFAGHTWKLS